MVNDPLAAYQEHPLDVLKFQHAHQLQGAQCALVMLTGTVGGAVRAPGALMAVTETGETCGYLSGGCIDADVALQAQAAMRERAGRRLRYGIGSPFMDIQLPCGGAIELAVHPLPEADTVADAIAALEVRSNARLTLQTGELKSTADYRPKLRLRIAGRGHDPVALAAIATSAGIEAEFWTADPDCLAAARTLNLSKTVPLTSPSSLPPIQDDSATAFVLMMHDTEWEQPLLASALDGDAFYIGAVGSPKTHAKRCQMLAEYGVPDSDIARIHGPIGLVPSLRDASMLAISTLAEIISVFNSVSLTTETHLQDMA